MERFSPWQTEPTRVLYQESVGSLICGDALAFLQNLKDEIADIVFLDPPFNLGKKYGNSEGKADLIPENEYAEFMQNILSNSIRVLKPGGALYLYHLPHWALRFGSLVEKKMTFRHWIAVSLKNGFPRRGFLYPAHYALLYFSKGEPRSFKRPKIGPPTCRHCGKYIKDYGGYLEYVKDGINLSDVWVDLSPVRHPSHKNRPANELPLELTRRVVEMSGMDKGLLVDPFVGAGTSIVAAVERGMHFLACDREESCCKISIQRLIEHLAQNREIEGQSG